MKAPVVSNVLPQDIRAVGGFMGQRFDANRVGRLKDALLSEQFIRLHERKNYDDWFWMGEQVGKWLDASAYAALIADDQALLARVEEIVSRLAASQEDDGYLGITSRFHRTPARGMELYEMYYVLHGLLVCYDLLGNEQALLTAQRLGDYIMALWGVEAGQFPLVGPFPGNGHDGGEGTLILEPIARSGSAYRGSSLCRSGVNGRWPVGMIGGPPIPRPITVAATRQCNSLPPANVTFLTCVKICTPIPFI